VSVNLRAGKWIVASACAVVLAFVAGSLTAAPAHGAVPSKKGPAVSRRGATTSFNFNNIPVRSALQLIAEEGHFNLIVSDSVQGNISVRLNDVTWEQAMDIVLRMKGLQQRVDGMTRSVTVAGG
jgi:type IV pilus assembly protein PilQ